MFRSSLILVPRVGHTLRYNSTAAYTNAITSLKKDLKQSMINKNEIEKNTIKGLLSEIKNTEIDNKSNHNDEFLLFDTYSKLIHQRKDSIENYLANKREDMAAKEQKEIEIIKKYQKALPVATQEEVDAKVLELLKFMKESEPSLQMKQIFGKINWKVTPTQWKTSAKSIRSSVVNQFKNVYTSN